jgi:hypothetical protein
MIAKAVRAFCLCATTTAVLVPATSAQEGKKTPYSYSQERAEKVQGELLTTAGVKIDTTKKPMPRDETVVVITVHENDPNWTDGGFYLDKTGGGYTTHIDGSRKHHVHAPLKGYGTTVSGKSWIYEVDGLKVGGKKVYAAISSEYSGNHLELRRVFISLGVDDPTDAGSFLSAGWALAGKREP